MRVFLFLQVEGNASYFVIEDLLLFVEWNLSYSAVPLQVQHEWNTSHARKTCVKEEVIECPCVFACGRS